MRCTNSNTVSFGSLIQVSKIAYAREVIDKLDMPNVAAPWTVRESKFLKYGLSEEASHCTMGVIKNEFGDGFMFHLRPGASTLEQIFDHLKKAVFRLKYAQNPTGILVGGNSGYPPSKSQYNNLQNMFKELNIEYSALLGQKELPSTYSTLPYCNMYFNGNQDKYVVCPIANSFRSINLRNKGELYNLFDTVIIRKGDEIKLD